VQTAMARTLKTDVVINARVSMRIARP